MELLTKTNINFMGMRKVMYFLSLAVILIGLGSIVIKGGLKYNIDFTGGLSMELEMKGVDAQQIRQALDTNGIKDAEIQEIPGTDQFIIKAKSEERTGDKIISILKQNFPQATQGNFIRSQEEVGPKAGFELRNQAIKAVLISILFILVYIGIRFRFSWGIAAALALFHDTIITLGLLSIMGREIGMTVLAALLTIVGYSINDTIVVFDRIREDLKLYRKEDEFHVFNRSINSTLSRTIITALTTLLADLALLIWGSPVIRDFALTFFIGVLVGTYSSIFVASAIVLDTVIAFRKKQKK